ncbi:dihydrofolate reductase [Alphaproteobacteria bacterium]|nr:dihydrofolate reductase [Alphaproteobacteria bacterium]MDC1022936.1 dihydrofolate reductase [Alphaproteobacteria bacterium]
MLDNNDLKFPLVGIVAMNQNRIIGDGNKLLWHLPGDLKRLKSLTMGTPLIMGRKTWDSIGSPLPGRGNIVLTQSKSWKADGAIVVNSFEDAIVRGNQWIEENKLNNELVIKDKIFLFGGAQIYQLGLQYCSVIEITKVIFDIKIGTKFPHLDEEEWKKTIIEHHKKDKNYPEFSYWQYTRKNMI